MILTLTILLQLTVGASFALACRYVSAQPGLWPGPSLPALLSYELGLVIPPCAYTLWRFPEAVLPNTLGIPACAGAMLLLACGGYIGARLSVRRERLVVGWGLAALGLLLLPFGAWLHGRQDLTGVRVQDNAHMVQLWRMVWPLQGVGWIFCLWRLSLFDLTQRRAAGVENPPSSLAVISAEVLSVLRSPGTRVHAHDRKKPAEREEPRP